MLFHCCTVVALVDIIALSRTSIFYICPKVRSLKTYYRALLLVKFSTTVVLVSTIIDRQVSKTSQNSECTAKLLKIKATSNLLYSIVVKKYMQLKVLKLISNKSKMLYLFLDFFENEFVRNNVLENSREE